MELWVVYNTTSGLLYLIKGRRLAERIASTMNKLYYLINNNEKVITNSATDFFKNHHIEKEKIIFCWDISFIDKMDIFKKFFVRKTKYDFF